MIDSHHRHAVPDRDRGDRAVERRGQTPAPLPVGREARPDASGLGVSGRMRPAERQEFVVEQRRERGRLSPARVLFNAASDLVDHGGGEVQLLQPAAADHRRAGVSVAFISADATRGSRMHLKGSAGALRAFLSSAHRVETELAHPAQAIDEVADRAPVAEGFGQKPRCSLGRGPARRPGCEPPRRALYPHGER